jgi:(S)-citramalyl-CoA lyase
MTATAIRPRRSLIFVPGDKPQMYPKALVTGADIVCVDLEDAVAPGDKDDARERTVALFAQHGPGDADGPERLVRINSLHTPEGLKDVTAFVDAAVPPKGLMLTKVKSRGEVVLLDDLLTECGMDTRLHVIIETNEGLDAAFAIAQASDRIDSMLFGAIDMAADLRTTPTWDNLFYARSRVVHAAAGAGVDLLDVPWLDLEDMEGLEREARAAAALGVTGKAAIHPKQIPILNEVFCPSAEEIERARSIIAAFEANTGGLVVIDGKLIEKPVLRSMQRIVAIAERIAARG